MTDETSDEQRHRVSSMSDEVERLKNDEGFNPDVDGDKAEMPDSEPSRDDEEYSCCGWPHRVNRGLASAA
jgi:hypothetical protein